jgi:phage/plasmid-like protein (TIGR03299 family)
MLHRAGLDWETEMRPVYAKIENGETVYKHAPRFSAITRADTHDVLGIASPIYQPVTNLELAELADAISDGSPWTIAAGSTRGGRRVWFLLQLPGELRVKGDDSPIDRHVLISGSHDGGGAVNAGFTPRRITCNNMLTAALKGLGHRISIRHTASAEERMKEAQKAMKAAAGFYERFAILGDALAETRFSDQQMGTLAEQLFPAKQAAQEAREIWQPREGESILGQITDATRSMDTVPIPAQTQRKRDEVIRLFQGSNTINPGIRGTAWGAYQAVTEYADHGRTYRSNNGGEAENRLDSVFFGSGHKLKSRALEGIIEATNLQAILKATTQS